MIARCLGASILFALLCDAAFALPTDRTIAQFHHTSWTAKDGGPSQVSALAQTADGYLWIGTAAVSLHTDAAAPMDRCALLLRALMEPSWPKSG